jgi:GH15 family glucan-1,4-alpha-glucosidase
MVVERTAPAGRSSPRRVPTGGVDAARELEGTNGPPSIYDYGLIGNLHTAALISRFGSVDWACFPQFDSPSAFARLLDLRRGGYFAIAPRERARPQQAYLPSTAILRTTFALPGSRSLHLTDFMPLLAPAAGERAPMIVRIAEAAGGPIQVDLMLDPRFDYARRPAKWLRDGHRWVGRSAAGSLTVRSAWPLRARGSALTGDAEMQDGSRAVFELYWGEERPTSDPCLELLRETEQFWTDWVHPGNSPIHLLAGRWHPWIERSEITLKLLSQADTGAFIAAATTSLPEWPGGARNWDYRYVWIRDAAFAAQSFALMGHVFEARSFLRWVVNILHRSTPGSRLRTLYPARGETDLTELELDYLEGYLGSRPVRIGNAASLQFQLDIYGELLDAARLLSDIEPDSLDRSWPLLEGLADQVVTLWRRPDRGIWELRSRPAHYVHSKIMAWVALDRAAHLGRQYGSRGPTVRWEREREAIRAAVLEHGYDRKRETFVQTFENHAVDAANLRIPLVGFLAPDDPRVAGTILRVEEELAEGPFVYRFRPSSRTGPVEGAFLPCSFWRVDCLARAGERERGRLHFEALLEASSAHGLFSEEYDPTLQRPLGNYPQAFTHIALLRAALALGLAMVPAAVLEQHPGLARAVRRRRISGAEALVLPPEIEPPAPPGAPPTPEARRRTRR